MPKYISAYELQNKNGWTREYVIEFAEIGPAYWKPKDEEFSKSDTKKGVYLDDGFLKLKSHALERWSAFAACCRNAEIKLIKMQETPWKRWTLEFMFNFNQLDEWLTAQPNADKCDTEAEKHSAEYVEYPEPGNNEIMSRKELTIRDQERLFVTVITKKLSDILPRRIERMLARDLLAEDAPDKYDDDSKGDFKMVDVLCDMKIEQLLKLFKAPKGTETTEALWKYLHYGSPVSIDLFFQRIFTDQLAFDTNNLPGESSVKPVVPVQAVTGLPGLYCTRRFEPKLDTNEATKNQVERTLALTLNKTAAQNIAIWTKAGRTREEIAQELKKNGGGIAVIGALLAPATVSKNGAIAVGKRLIGQKK